MDGGCFMNFVQILGTCPPDLVDILAIVKWVITLICWAIPIILVVLIILDVAKIVTAGNIDDKLKKEVTGRITTRVIFAIIIFLVPTLVRTLFSAVPVKNKDVTFDGATWRDCWDGNVANQ